MSIAWFVRTRPNNIATTAVAHKQTKCSNPRIIDQRDLDYDRIHRQQHQSRDIQLFLYVDVSHVRHEDKRSHTGGMVTMGKQGDGGVPIV
jgi:hypothetical protein